MKRALCIWLPEWPIQRLVVTQPELKTRPLVLHARDARRGRLVVDGCHRARLLGVVPGMPLAEVAALVRNSASNHDPQPERAPQTSLTLRVTIADEKCSHASRSGHDQLALHEHEPQLDHAALLELAIWCEQFSPIVGVEQTDQPSSLLLDITGLAPLFGSEARLAEQIHREFAKRGYQVRVGVADTIGAAWAIAHYTPAESDAFSTIADAPMAIADDARALAPLPIEALRLPAETIATLHQLGIETIAQLLQLPRDGLAVRLGALLMKRIDQALGNAEEVIVAHRPPPEFTATWSLEHPTERRDAIETMLTELARRVARTLAKHGHAAVQVQAELRGRRRSRLLEVSLFRPSNQAEHLDELLKLQLETAQMCEPVQSVSLSAVTTVRVTGEQHLLWDEVGQGRDGQVAALIDRLSSRLGKECVFGVQAQAGALPERAYRKKLLADTIHSRRRPQKTATSLKAPHRPLWLHDPPQPLRMTSVVRAGDRPPAAFQFQNQQYQVVRHWGPERIETGWWAGRSVRRDYYRVETQQGYRFWLFRQLDDGAWFLHGCFE